MGFAYICICRVSGLGCLYIYIYIYTISYPSCSLPPTLCMEAFISRFYRILRKYERNCCSSIKIHTYSYYIHGYINTYIHTYIHTFISYNPGDQLNSKYAYVGTLTIGIVAVKLIPVWII